MYMTLINFFKHFKYALKLFNWYKFCDIQIWQTFEMFPKFDDLLLVIY